MCCEDGVSSAQSLSTLGLVLVTACGALGSGEDSRGPGQGGAGGALADGGLTGGASAGGASSVDGSATWLPCDTTTIPLGPSLGELYFVVDTSASMGEPAPGGRTKWEVTRDA